MTFWTRKKYFQPDVIHWRDWQAMMRLHFPHTGTPFCATDATLHGNITIEQVDRITRFYEKARKWLKQPEHRQHVWDCEEKTPLWVICAKTWYRDNCIQPPDPIVPCVAQYRFEHGAHRPRRLRGLGHYSPCIWTGHAAQGVTTLNLDNVNRVRVWELSPDEIASVNKTQ